MSIHDILTTVAALAAVIVMILLARFGTRFAGLVPRRGPTGSALSIDASLPLDPRRRLNLIGCQGRQLLLLTGGPSDVLLGWLPPADPHPPGDAP
jgi:flagellar protein FliO/FliZ